MGTPGHRPEHVSLLVTDLACSFEPCLLLAGDSVLAGGLARPDLATITDRESEQAARDLFATASRLSRLPDYVEIWPGHIGGSLCAVAGLSGRLSSTIGYERRSNLAFTRNDEAGFVRDVTAGLGDRPPTVDVVVALNRRREEVAQEPLTPLGPHEVGELVRDGAAVIDGRPAEAFDEGSIPGSFSVPLEALAVGARAAWCTDPAGPVVAVGEDDAGGLELAARLAAVGFQDVRGILTQGFRSWASTALPVRETWRLEPAEVDDLLAQDAVTLVDLRDRDEYAACHVSGALHLPWRELRWRGSEAFDPGKPVVVGCATGGRTPLGASMLARHGSRPVARLINGGIGDLRASVPTRGHPSRGFGRGSSSGTTPGSAISGSRRQACAAARLALDESGAW
jgi:rhodanese-related sulfurtransferase